MGDRTALGVEDRRLLRDHKAIIGIDEVGRGSLAGPVVVCAVKWGKIPSNPAVRDSKKVSSPLRKELSAWIRERASSWVLVEVWPEVIDRINILKSTKVAMRAALETLHEPGTAVVVDAVDLGEGFEWVHHPIKADDRFFSVASASILAKHARDELMVALAPRFGEFQWERNKGYGTAVHRAAMQSVGRTYLHRSSFRLKNNDV